MLTFFAIDENFITGTTGWLGTIFIDLKPLIYLFIGLQAGFFIIESIVNMIGDRLETRTRLAEEKERIKSKVVAGILKPYKAHKERILTEEIKKELFKEA